MYIRGWSVTQWSACVVDVRVLALGTFLFVLRSLTVVVLAFFGLTVYISGAALASGVSIGLSCSGDVTLNVELSCSSR